MKPSLAAGLLTGACCIFACQSGFAETGGNRLTAAAKAGDLEQVEALLANGTPADARNEQGQTALMWAAAQAEREIVRLLLDARADPNALSNSPEGVHVLTWATSSDSADVIETLIQAGAEVDARGRNGLSPLGKALHDNGEKAFQVLIKHGADVNYEAILYTTHDRRQAMLTPLMATAFSGNPDFVAPLIERGARIDETNDLGDTALMLAIRHSQTDLARALIEAGADVNARQDNGYTALIFAGHLGLAEVIKLLVENGADPHATATRRLGSDSEFDGASLAWEHGHVESAILLEKAKENTDPAPTSPIAVFSKERATGNPR